MNDIDSRCNVVSGLIGRWHLGRLREVDLEAFEQHLLYCPPCLVQHDKARAALGVLRSVPDSTAPPRLVEDLRSMVLALTGE